MDRMRNIIREELQKLANEDSYKNNYGLPEWFDLKHFAKKMEYQKTISYQTLHNLIQIMENQILQSHEKVEKSILLLRDWYKKS